MAFNRWGIGNDNFLTRVASKWRIVKILAGKHVLILCDFFNIDGKTKRKDC